MVEKNIKMGIAWYKPEQWERLREISIDRKDIEFTYTEWLANAQRALQQILFSGQPAQKVEVDVEELFSWCKSIGLEVNGKSRSAFAAEKLRQQDIVGG